MEVSVRELIREAKNAVNARFDMLEQIISLSSSPAAPAAPAPAAPAALTAPALSSIIASYNELYEAVNQQDDEIKTIHKMLHQLTDVVQNIQKKIDSMNVSDHMPELQITQGDDNDYCEECGRECDGVHGASGEKAVTDMKSRGLEVKDDKIVKIQEEEVVETVEEDVEEADEDEDEDEDEAVEDIVEDVEEEEAVEDDEEEEQEGIELEEFEYKGITLYRDPENKVYRMDEEGALSDPIGVWDEVKQRIKKL